MQCVGPNELYTHVFYNPIIRHMYQALLNFIVYYISTETNISPFKRMICRQWKWANIVPLAFCKNMVPKILAL